MTRQVRYRTTTEKNEIFRNIRPITKSSSLAATCPVNHTVHGSEFQLFFDDERQSGKLRIPIFDIV